MAGFHFDFRLSDKYGLKACWGSTEKRDFESKMNFSGSSQLCKGKRSSSLAWSFRSAYIFSGKLSGIPGCSSLWPAHSRTRDVPGKGLGALQTTAYC